MYYRELAKAAFSYPAIDNHAHPFLSERHRNALAFEGLTTEASGVALPDSIYTLACYRSTAQLAKLFGLKGDDANWDGVKTKRAGLDYKQLCGMCMKPSGIQCILIDDGLSGVADLAEGYRWHDQFTASPTKRIVRIEALAEKVLLELVRTFEGEVNAAVVKTFLPIFITMFMENITTSARDPEVVGFKSIACYRTGLDISTSHTKEEIEQGLLEVWKQYEAKGVLRLAHKALNDRLVRIVLGIAGEAKKPVQFHTGLGDNDITLTKSSPAHMQTIIQAYPDTIFVLLHSSYPYTRDAGYLTAMYKNVYLDFGEIFPALSADGQRAVVKQMLELSPTNKILWSTDGHWWPETYYLASIQSRQALYEVLAECIRRDELTELQAATIVENMLFHNSNKVYDLGLVPKLDIVM
ncbi:hypothetical protein SCLCIDRAFT_1223624 [Scleroderma citrinum Foug A]|uniref:Amidohydrolase-related domain-containing protein n=1 Tax=Scleroderma citrinum Foug A TaxID=1036808 RepID=A0A0C3CVG1_9AGAM|nr:hypothetical protein SCLCIDRAFT_1223624 [Scleroderma citrinum Foug A]